MNNPDSLGIFTLTTNGSETNAYRDGVLAGRYFAENAPGSTAVSPVRPPLASDKLSGPKLKIERAKSHIIELERVAQAFHASNPYEIVCDIDPKTGENVFRIIVKEGIPNIISAIVGDAVHNLRCALDFMVCDLARANGKVPNQNGGFPIKRRAEKLKTGSVPKIKGVSARAERLILWIKARDSINGPLFVLNMLDVLDKHNSITSVAAATVGITNKIGVPGLFVGPNGEFCIGGGSAPLMVDAGTPMNFKVTCLTEDNVEIYRSPAAGFNEYVQATIAIALGKTDTIEVEGRPIIDTLKEFTYLIERIIAVFERRCL